MKRSISVCCGALSLIIVACGNPSADEGAGESEGAATQSTEISPSVVYAEAKALSPDPKTKADAAKAYAALNYSVLTPCDMMLWADVDDPTLETAPANFAAWAGGAAVKSPKKKMPFQDARVLAGTYLAFTDADAAKTRKVRKDWVQALIDRGVNGVKSPRLKDIKKTSAGDLFSAAAVNECNVFMDSITQSTWGCLQHLVADYVAVKSGRGNLASSPELVKFPFYGWLDGAPGAAVTPASDETRRYVLPTVSYRTMKALSGYWPKVGKQKELQELATEAVKYFENNELDDYRAKAKKPGKANWVGYWENDGAGKAIAYCDFKDAAAELKSTP